MNETRKYQEGNLWAKEKEEILDNCFTILQFVEDTDDSEVVEAVRFFINLHGFNAKLLPQELASAVYVADREDCRDLYLDCDGDEVSGVRPF